ncbi:hypothetical protein AYI68_g3258 [Smittium mucronatum]|uniref:Uncharacterized protein n=1 Tax=Smittium mucronatum TaxID=133383 RepID=A0A1R0H0F6_9FUNG|nr:hypothetical protein AYI68_g3258 [Smittium mucronatum]
MEDLMSSLLGLSLSSGPNPPVRFLTSIPTVGAVHSLSAVSTGSDCRSLNRLIKEAIPSLSSLFGEGDKRTSKSTLNFESPLDIQKQFGSKDLYHFNWYRKSASDNAYIL